MKQASVDNYWLTGYVWRRQTAEEWLKMLIQRSESIANIAAALVTAQGQIDDASKDSRNDHFRSKYADLAAVRAVIREPLAVNDIAVIQTPALTDEGVRVETMLLHKSGEYIAGSLTIPLQKRDAHGIGSAITYARRYLLMSMLCIASEDDDGNAAVRTSGGNQQQDSSKSDPEVLADRVAELVAEGGYIARNTGTDGLFAWWKSLKETERRAIPQTSVAAMKAEAATADKAKGGGNEAGN